MTRWLQAALSAQMTKAKTDTTDKTPVRPANAGRNAGGGTLTKPRQGEVLSVTPPPKGEVLSVKSALSVSSVVSGRIFDAPTAPAETRAQSIHPSTGYTPDAHGFCRTWTGRIVRLDEWRDMSAWDRHGPAGGLFCGICKQWVGRDADCPQPECWKGGAA